MPATAETTKVADTKSTDAPVIVDIGKKRKRLIRQLREGRGPLMDEINGVLEELRTAGTISGSAQPVVVVVQQKRKARSMMFPFA